MRGRRTALHQIGAGFKPHRQPLLRPVPELPYDLPLHVKVEVRRDHHVIVDGAAYSLPTSFIGARVQGRADRELVKIYHRGHLVKTHPRQPPGGRSTDPKDYPSELRIYATRDEKALRDKAREAGKHVGVYAERLLDAPHPWMRMRHVYRLLGLVRRYGADRVERACERALELDVVDVTRIARMLERALEGGSPEPPPSASAPVVFLRFARPVSHFAAARAAADGGSDE